MGLLGLKLDGKLQLRVLLFLLSLGILESCALVVSNPKAGKTTPGTVASVKRYLPDQISVEPLYSGASEWNDYVMASDTSQACDGNPNNECKHAGEAKKIVVTGVSSCSGLTISEALNAFDWLCEVVEGVATFKTHSLKTGKGLSDLLNTSGFLNNAVSVTYAGESVSSTPSVWWSNQVIGLTSIQTPSDMSSFGMTSFNLDGDSSIEVYKLNSPGLIGRIFVIGANLNIEGMRIEDDKTALVVLPGFAVTRIAGSDGNNCASLGTTCLIDGESVKYSWIEGTFAAASASYNVAYRSSEFNRFQNLFLKDVNGSSVGSIMMTFDAAYRNQLNQLKIINAEQQGLYLYGSSNRFENLEISNNHSNWYGLMLASASTNYFSGLRLSNIAGDALKIVDSSSNVFVDTMIAGASGSGVAMTNSSSNIFMGLTSVNIGGVRNIQIIGGDNNVLSNAVAANSPDVSVFIDGADKTQFNNTLAWANNYAYYLMNSDSVEAYGHLKNSATTPCTTLNLSNNFGTQSISDIGSGYCYVPGATATPINPSNINFNGPVRIDTLNLNNGDLFAWGFLSYASILDWFNFDSNYRMWGKTDALSPPENPLSTNARGRCSSGNCTVWDWRLKSSDSLLAFQNGVCSGGGDYLESFWFGATIKYLRNAYEISYDNIGNDNLLCESEETCVYMPHMGAFQGDGDIVASSCANTFPVAPVSSVRFKEFENLIY